MLANDFVWSVAFDAFGACIPAYDDAVGIEHKEGVICNARHQQAELALAVADGLLRGTAFGDIARYLRKPFEFPCFVADCVHDDHRPEPTAVLAHTPALAFVASLASRYFKNAG